MPDRRSGLFAVSVLVGLAALTGCQHIDIEADQHEFPKGKHSLDPRNYGWGPQEDTDLEWRTSVGRVEQPVDEQPITFNHSIHTSDVEDGGMAMECQYCHSNVRQSKHAGVPPVETCEGCHKMVGTEGRPELEKLKQYLTGGELHGQPIPWVKVHDLPDFVHFNHSRHIKGGLDCTECHADMREETVAVRDVDMTMEMGWCLECHGSHPAIDETYGTAAETRRAELKDCYTCHQ
jgi:hypothetical protein